MMYQDILIRPVISEKATNLREQDKYVFVVALPALVFQDLTENDIRSHFDGGYVLFCFLVCISQLAK